MKKTEYHLKPSPAVLDELLRDVPLDVNLDTFDDMFRGLKKALMERMLQGEKTHHLGYAKNSSAEGSNPRNGTSVITDQDQIPPAIVKPRLSRRLWLKVKPELRALMSACYRFMPGA